MADGRPNILFLYPDTLRYDWLETRGAVPVRTPNAARLAGEGIEFTRAVTPSPLCAPARACLASGMEYDRAGVPGNDVNYPLDQASLYKLLRDSGYHVMGCGKFDLHKPELDWGPGGRRLINEWGFSDGIDNEGKMDGVNSFRRSGGAMGPYLDYLATRGLADAHVADFARRKRTSVFPTPLPDDAYCDNWLAANGLELLARAPADGPWFLQVNFTGPHAPWDITHRMAARWRGVEHPGPVASTKLTPDEHDGIRQNYSAMVENIDRWIGVYLGELERRGELGNTLVVLSSDHGDMLGDHDRWGKSKPRQGSAAAPLVIMGPGVRRGARHDGPATTLDLTATFLEYAGCDVPSGMDSRSLKPILEGPGNAADEGREYVLSGLHDWRLAFDGRHKLVRRAGEGDILYDLQEDPDETENAAGRAPEVAARLGEALDRERAKGTDAANA
ncbi:MAG: sulfatase family protein [Planctomycetota bacterium]|jgi:arylsulfatase A-like enzyme